MSTSGAGSFLVALNLSLAAGVGYSVYTATYLTDRSPRVFLELEEPVVTPPDERDLFLPAFADLGDPLIPGRQGGAQIPGLEADVLPAGAANPDPLSVTPNGSGETQSDDDVAQASVETNIVPLKSEFVTVLMGEPGRTRRAILDDEILFFRKTSKENDSASIEVSFLPYAGNEYRLADFPGFCERLSLVRSNSELWLWKGSLPAGVSGSLLAYAQKVDNSLSLRASSTPMQEGGANVWVGCSDSLVNGSPPFLSDEVWTLFDEISLKSSTSINLEE